LHPPAPAGTRRHPPAPARRPAGLARPATGHGPAARPRVADTATATDGTGTAARTRTDTDGHGKPATVETRRSAGTVAAVCEQKSRQPAREAGKGKRPALKRGRRLGWVSLLYARNGGFRSYQVAGRKLFQREPPRKPSVDRFNADFGHDCTGPEETDKPRTDLWNHAPPSLSHQL